MIVNDEGGGIFEVPPGSHNSWNEWFAVQFNAYCGIGTSSGETQTAQAEQNATLINEYRQELIRLVNEERERAGLAPYIVSPECMEYSQIRAEELFVDFSHTRPDGSNAGYEIIHTGAKTPEGAVIAWMNSPTHKAAILNENRVYVGAGVSIASNGVFKWEMYFEYDPNEYHNTLTFG